MTQDEIIDKDEVLKMAKQAGLIFHALGNTPKELEAFAKLVEDKVTARYMQLFLDPENQPTQFGTATQEYRELEIKAEREACAILVQREWSTKLEKILCDELAAYIRARGEA